MIEEDTSMIRQLSEELHDELTNNILTFWMTEAVDEDYGGFIGHIDFFGHPTPQASKGAILNARILWTFSAAYRVLGNPGYLHTARRAFDYIKEYFIDVQHGGVFWELDYKGQVLNPRKQIYALAFTVYGLTEYYKINQESAVLEMAVSLYRDIEEHSFDRIRNGYYEAFSRDWKPIEDLRLSEKDQNENKTMNTHLHILEAYTNLFRIWKDKGLEKTLDNLVRLFLEKFVSEDYHLNLFFDDDWKLKSDLVSYGHDIESSWLLYEAAVVLDSEELMEIIHPLAVGIALNNFQGLADDGGLIYEFFPSENRKDKDRHWWPQAEALMGYFNAWQLSGDKHFLDAAIRSWEYIKSHMIDHNNGEWHWSVDHLGNPNKQEEKAGFWKCPYHNSRACLEIIERTNSLQ